MCSWFSKLLGDVAFTWRPKELSCWLKKWHILGNLAIWTVRVLGKILFPCFLVSREINLRLCSKSQWQMFLLVFGRYVGAYPEGHQHGVSIKISINLDKKFIRISRLRIMRKITVTKRKWGEREGGSRSSPWDMSCLWKLFLDERKSVFRDVRM